jgi:hypothetical protein
VFQIKCVDLNHIYILLEIIHIFKRCTVSEKIDNVRFQLYVKCGIY